MFSNQKYILYTLICRIIANGALKCVWDNLWNSFESHRKSSKWLRDNELALHLLISESNPYVRYKNVSDCSLLFIIVCRLFCSYILNNLLFWSPVRFIIRKCSSCKCFEVAESLRLLSWWNPQRKTKQIHRRVSLRHPFFHFLSTQHMQCHISQTLFCVFKVHHKWLRFLFTK